MTLPVSLSPASPETIEHGAEIIRRGGLVAFPTETVYGLGADAFAREAVERIYAVKGRPAVNPLIVHIAAFEDLDRVADLGKDSRLRQRLERLAPLWPGPLSIILPKAERLPAATTANLPSVAVRIPAHPVARALIAAARTPVAAPSANRSTYVSPTTAAHVATDIGTSIDLIIDGGPCAVGLESTIVSLVHPAPTLLRHGGLTPELLEAALGEPLEDLPEHTVSTTPLSPGLLRLHYAPRTPLVFRRDRARYSRAQRVVLVTFSPAHMPVDEADFAAVARLSPTGDLTEAARNLFATLRRLDQEGFDLIVVEECARSGLGRAIMDRLARAAAERGES